MDLILARMTAQIMNKHPMISLGVIVSPKISTPPKTAKTDSRQRINDAAVGGAYFCPYIFFVVGILSVPLMLLFEHPTVAAVISCKASLLFAGVLTCGIAYTLQIYGQKYAPPTAASLILCLESVFAVLGGVLILGETMTPKEIMGCLFMICAVILANIKSTDCSRL